MYRPSRAALGLLLAAAALSCARPAGAQLTEGILSPAGRLRLEVSPEFDLWSRRYTAAGDVVPLGFDLEQHPLDLGPLQQSLQGALGGTAPPLVLGSMRALVSRDRTRMTFGGALGITDWLTVGAAVPLVKARTEIAFDFRTTPGANVGANPRLSGDGRADAFIGSLSQSRAALAARVAQRCPGAADCAALNDLLGRYTSFANALFAGYLGSPVFVAMGSAPGTALQARLTALAAEIAQRAPGVAVPGTVPLATAPLDQKSFTGLLTDPAAGLSATQPLETTPNDWGLGDAEVSVAVRVLEGAVRDSAGAPDRLHYVLGAQGLVRLPTGHPDDPNVPLDLGTGDGQTDFEGGAFGDLRWTKLGLRAEARYGVQRPTELVRRVAPAEVVFPPLLSLGTVTWTPGNYLSIDLAPSWYLADEFAVGGTYRLWSKQADTYRHPSSTQDDAASVLAQDTSEQLHELGLGLAFSTLDGWREGRASLPFELRLMIRRAISGSGRAVPKGTRMEATGRVFWRLWGAEPERAAAPPPAR